MIQEPALSEDWDRGKAVVLSAGKDTNASVVSHRLLIFLCHAN